MDNLFTNQGQEYNLAQNYRIQKVATGDIDQLSSLAQQWNQNYQQLTPGNFQGKLSEICFPGIQIYREQANQSLYQEGMCLRNAIAFAIPLVLQGQGYYCSYDLTLDSLMMLNQGEQFQLRMPHISDHIVVAIDFNLFSHYTRKIAHGELSQKLKDQYLLLSSQAQIRKLRSYLVKNFTKILSHPDLIANSQAQSLFTEEILEQFVDVLLPVTTIKQKAFPNYSSTLINTAQEYIKAHQHQPLTVSQICQVTGVSRRTLQSHFQKMFGISPKRYLKIHRLHGLRQALKSAHPDTHTVMSLATDWGFFHRGHLAADYSSLFQELPSDTLKQF